MSGRPDQEPLTWLREAAGHVAGLDLLLLFGSRARGTAHEGSDWDFAYLARGPFDADDLRAARDGVVVVEARPGIDAAFRLAAARFWCDAEPVLRRGYDEVLAGLES